MRFEKGDISRPNYVAAEGQATMVRHPRPGINDEFHLFKNPLSHRDLDVIT